MEVDFILVRKGRMRDAIVTFHDRKSLDECAIACVHNVACVSINHHQGNMKCQLLDVNYDERKMDVTEGWRHYDTPNKGKKI